MPKLRKAPSETTNQIAIKSKHIQQAPKLKCYTTLNITKITKCADPLLITNLRGIFDVLF